MRGLLVSGHDVADVVEHLGWSPATGRSIPLDWPDAEYVTVISTWRSENVPVALVEDRFILRTYVSSIGAGGSTLLHRLVQQGVLIGPQILVDEARRSPSRWAELGDTLYDLVAGCIDSDRDDIYEIWERRLADEHPLIRLAACWVGPYLVGDGIVAALEATASTDHEPQVRTAAAASCAALRRREHW